MVKETNQQKANQSKGRYSGSLRQRKGTHETSVFKKSDGKSAPPSASSPPRNQWGQVICEHKPWVESSDSENGSEDKRDSCDSEHISDSASDIESKWWIGTWNCKCNNVNKDIVFRKAICLRCGENMKDCQIDDDLVDKIWKCTTCGNHNNGDKCLGNCGESRFSGLGDKTPKFPKKSREDSTLMMMAVLRTAVSKALNDIEDSL